METFEMYRRPDFMVLPELVSLGMWITSESRIGGPREDRWDGLEIGYLDTGSVEWWDGSELDEAGPDTVLIDRPGDWQGGTSAIVHPCRRYWIRFNFPPLGEIPGLPDSSILAFKQVFEGIERRYLPAPAGIKTLFRALIYEQREPDAFSEDVSRAVFHQILVQVVRAHEHHSKHKISQPIANARLHISQNLDSDLRVEGIAARVGLSTGYFHELFLRETGFTPAHFHLRMRIRRAKELLITSPKSVTEIAMDLGFSSSQYFSTAFKKIVGLTPVSYRNLRCPVSN